MFSVPRIDQIDALCPTTVPLEVGEMVRSVFPVVCAPDIDAARDFYAEILELDVVFECGWYTLLRSPVDETVQLGFVTVEHETVPRGFGGRPAGLLVTVEVDDVDDVYERALGRGAEIALPLRDEEFGQRHFMAVDPNGVLLDVVTPIAPSRSFIRDVARWRRATAATGGE